MMTPEQCKAARAMLRWDQRALAEAAGVTVTVITNFETGLRRSQRNSMLALEAAFTKAGVMFTNGGGGRVGVSIGKLKGRRR